MDRPRRIKKGRSILPPEDSEDSFADDSDEDPDYDPQRRKSLFSFFQGNFLTKLEYEVLKLNVFRF